MFLRYLFISFLKWVSFTLLSALLLGLVVPKAWSGYVVSVPMWFVAFCLAFGFAEWAFKTHLPRKRDLTLLVLIWMAVTIIMQLIYTQLVLGSVIFMVNSLEIYVQYLLEIFAIFLAFDLTRRRRLKSVMTEGMME